MRALISAYACEPRRGSEPGAGWLWTLAAAVNHDVTVLTRASRRTAFSPGDDPESLTIEFVDLPRPLLRVVQKHDRLYYVLWQVVAGRAARRMHRAAAFDVVHHVTFANAWLPALVHWAPAPFVLGPVGGGPTIPRILLSELDWRGRLFELARRTARTANSYNPLVRSGWHRASVIVAQNPETRAQLPKPLHRKVVVRWNAVVGPDLEHIVRDERRAPASSQPKAVIAGRLLLWKGGTLAVRALTMTREPWRLEIVGSGPAEKRLRALVADLSLSDRVTFTPWVAREELWRRIRDATVVVAPSLRDDAPLLVAEAQALGVPVIALDQGGPGAMADAPGSTITLIPITNSSDVVGGLASALDETADRARETQPCLAFGLKPLESFIDTVYEQATND